MSPKRSQEDNTNYNCMWEKKVHPGACQEGKDDNSHPRYAKPNIKCNRDLLTSMSMMHPPHCIPLALRILDATVLGPSNNWKPARRGMIDITSVLTPGSPLNMYVHLLRNIRKRDLDNRDEITNQLCLASRMQ